MTDAAERAAAIFVRRYEALNEEYLALIGERIRKIGRVSPTDLYRLERLRDIGADMDRLKRRLATETGRSLKELERLMEQAAEAAMRPYDGLANAEPYLTNELAETTAAAQYRETARAMVNLSNTTVSAEAYQKLTDRAISAVQLGSESYQGAIRGLLRNAAWDGLRVEDGTRRVRYRGGLTRRLDTAARQNVLDGVRALMQRVRDEAGRAFGADGVEISAHMLCAEDHLPYQGRQFSLEAFEQLNQTLSRPIAKGMWNCSHVAEPIVLGVSEPAYTEEELAQYRESSEERITIDGKTRSRYQWTQEQRRLETAVRRHKDCAIAAKAAGDDMLRRECQQHINDCRKRYERISGLAGLEARGDRMAVSGFRAVKVSDDLTFIANDAKLKKASGLPKVLKGLPDETLKGTADIDTPVAQGVVPKGADLTSVCVIAGKGTSTPIHDLKRLYVSYPKYGRAEDWEKKTGIAVTDTYRYEMHWYENNGQMPPGEIKTKGVKRR